MALAMLTGSMLCSRNGTNLLLMHDPSEGIQHRHKPACRRASCTRAACDVQDAATCFPLGTSGWQGAFPSLSSFILQPAAPLSSSGAEWPAPTLHMAPAVRDLVLLSEGGRCLGQAPPGGAAVASLGTAFVLPRVDGPVGHCAELVGQKCCRVALVPCDAVPGRLQVSDKCTVLHAWCV